MGCARTDLAAGGHDVGNDGGSARRIRPRELHAHGQEHELQEGDNVHGTVQIDGHVEGEIPALGR